MRHYWPIYAWTIVLVMLSLGVGVKYSREPSLSHDFGTRLSEMFRWQTQPGIHDWVDRVVRRPFS